MSGVRHGQAPLQRSRECGASNREIAQRQFVSIKAVEWHLGNAFSKLRIGSRHELGDALAVAE